MPAGLGSDEHSLEDYGEGSVAAQTSNLLADQAHKGQSLGSYRVLAPEGLFSSAACCCYHLRGATLGKGRFGRIGSDAEG